MYEATIVHQIHLKIIQSYVLLTVLAGAAQCSDTSVAVLKLKQSKEETIYC